MSSWKVYRTKDGSYGCCPEEDLPEHKTVREGMTRASAQAFLKILELTKKPNSQRPKR